MPRMKVPSFKGMPAGVDTGSFMTGAPMTTIGPGSVPLEQMQRYFSKAAQNVLPELQSAGIPLEDVIKSINTKLSASGIPEMGEKVIDATKDPGGYVNRVHMLSSGATLAANPGKGSDASLLEMLIDDLTKHFSGLKYDPFK